MEQKNKKKISTQTIIKLLLALYEGDCFPIETFSGKGKIEEIEVSCIEPYSQVMFHLGYEFDENDVHDVKLLCETFHIEIPNEYR